jgi:hypothetical protein
MPFSYLPSESSANDFCTLPELHSAMAAAGPFLPLGMVVANVCNTEWIRTFGDFETKAHWKLLAEGGHLVFLERC